MGEETELLIENVKKYTYLYDPSHKLYKNVVKKVETWALIAEELNITSNAAKAKWKNLRDCYLRYKKSLKNVTGQTKKYQKWPWSDHLKFLDDVLCKRSTINIPSVEIEDSISLKNEIPEGESESEEDRTEVAEASSQMPPPKKRMTVRSTVKDDASIAAVIEYLESKPAKREFDGVDHLFLSYADTFRKFQPRTQALLKIKLATLFARTEMREVGTPFPSNYGSHFLSH